MVESADNARRLEVRQQADVALAGHAVKELSLSAGLDEVSAEEMQIVARELASNIVRHAGGGTVMTERLEAPGKRGVLVVAEDRGPGLPGSDRAFEDGFSRAGSLGYGLGAVNRLTDELEVISPVESGVGTRITCRRWRRSASTARPPRPLDVGAASHPHPRQKINGDAFVIKSVDSSTLVGVIDGVGHGEHARRAAFAARGYIQRHAGQPLGDLFKGVDRACRATRGVVMAMARLTWNSAAMSHASVGNIEARLRSTREGRRFVVRRGILGFNAPVPVVTDHPWGADEILVLHSDCISAQWSWDDEPTLWHRGADHIARRLLRKHSKNEDDATVLVVKGGTI